MSLQTVTLSLGSAVLVCSAVSVAFVGSLYVLVPPKIRQLDRDDARQVRWRAFATGTTCILASGIIHFVYPGDEPGESLTVDRNALAASLRVLFHTMFLYLGPIVQMMETTRSIQCEGYSYWGMFRRLYISPLAEDLRQSGNTRWIKLRNLLIAPFLEEWIFRGLVVNVLSKTGLTTGQICFAAPLFFGIAHAHHAVHQAQLGISKKVIAFRSLFQMTYTSLFGAYASYTFLATGSFLPAFWSHAFCNGMGLPDLHFRQPSSPLYRYRSILWAAHVAGVALFAGSFGLVRSST